VRGPPGVPEPDPAELRAFVGTAWRRDALPTLQEYTRVPCLSPAFAPDWEQEGALLHAAHLLCDWARARSLPGLQAEVVAPAGRTPLLVVDVPATDRDRRDTHAGPAVLVYGHLDKQPPQGEWRPGLGPYEPVLDGERLYGRGTADDGYSLFAALVGLQALAAAGVPAPRVMVLIEASEESGSPDLTAHLTDLQPRLGTPELVVCLDSGCLTYDRLWLTSSLRGNLVVTLRVDVLSEGVHSGLAGGVVPSSFRILRELLSRVEDERTGEILLPGLRAEVPEPHRRALQAVAEHLGDAADHPFPAVPGLRLAGTSVTDRLLRNAWAPALAVTGMDGIPATRDAGNVLRPYTTAKISLRLPPTVDATWAAGELARVLTADPPNGARVTVTTETPADGWVAPDPAPWVWDALTAASRGAFGEPPGSLGEGGTIPFLPALSSRFPGAQFVATGVLGPESNAHGPNEFLHLPMAEAVTCAVAYLVAAARAGAAPRAATSPH